MSYNKVILLGNVGKAPEAREISGGKVVSFSLATTERYKTRSGEVRENTDWFNCICWRAIADFAEKYVNKGDQVFLEGKIRNRKYTAQSGEEKLVTEIIVDRMQTCGKRDDNKPKQVSAPADTHEEEPF